MNTSEQKLCDERHQDKLWDKSLTSQLKYSYVLNFKFCVCLSSKEDLSFSGKADIYYKILKLFSKNKIYDGKDN